MKSNKIIYLPFDTETTGINFRTSQVIQAGAVFCDENLSVIHNQEWNINYDLKNDWSLEAEDIHGISLEEATSHGMSTEEFGYDLRDSIHRIYGSKSGFKFVPVGVQAYFDFVMLDASIYSDIPLKNPLSYKMFGDLSCIGHHVNGISALDKQLLHYGIQSDNSKRHSALYDAEMHHALFCKLMIK